MDLKEIYQKIDGILEQVPFGDIFPQFRKCKFAVYNRDEICLSGELMPYNENFRGNTSILYNGERIAIWFCDEQETSDLQILAYCLVHEMFHAFQIEHGETRFPNDLAMLNIPLSPEFYSIKYEENRQLAEACRQNNADSFGKFFELRNLRLQKFPKATTEELLAETIEGTAEFAGLSALKLINKDKYGSRIDDYLNNLTDRELLFSARRLAYYTGTVFCFALKKFGHPVINNFTDQSLYNQNLLYAQTGRGNTAFDWVKQELDTKIKHERELIESKISGSEFKELQATVCGYDPMNMIRCGNLILCSHFVLLMTETGQQFFNTPVVLKLLSDSDDSISGYYNVN